jgi:Ser/Thr protein kinase RdoA (MazF antagonist)
MAIIDFKKIVRKAWENYDHSRKIKRVADISAMVSTNHVYKVTLRNGQFIIAKLSYFGQYEHFVEDHSIINNLSNNLPYPFENFLSRALMNREGLYVYRHEDDLIDAWVIFYRPVSKIRMLPKRLSEDQIRVLARQFALFHQACDTVKNTLPPYSKTMKTDVDHLLRAVNSEYGKYEFGVYDDLIRKHSELFKKNCQKLGLDEFSKIPVFVDWNIGNFSVYDDFSFYSRWDYDWFRVGTRMLDFYFISRIVSDRGDKTVFSYLTDPLTEDRFMLFLAEYHEVFPLHAEELMFLKEMYRFFILNYVVHFGNYFFHDLIAKRLQKEAYESYLPQIDNFDPQKIVKRLGL